MNLGFFKNLIGSKGSLAPNISVKQRISTCP
jgi:hypothetical protein